METKDNDLLCRLFQAYYDARKNKRGSINQLKFEINYEAWLIQLYQDILTRNYRIKPSIAFIIDNPLKREVFAADFSDRVVHHLLFNMVNPVFEELFIDESFSCRVGRGTHYGINKLNNAIVACSNHYQEDCYILKLDIQGYFMNINKIILKKILYREITGSSSLSEDDKDLVFYLAGTILDDDPTRNYRIKGSRKNWQSLPRSKSLFHSPENCGLPIGNLTSQLFSNVYLNGFDHFVKGLPGVTHYGRYVDDFYVVHESRSFLKNLISYFQTYLKTELALELHPGKIYLQHYSKGVNYLGATIKPFRRYVSNRTKKKFKKCIRDWEQFLKINTPSKQDLHRMRASINSYLGILQHYRAYNIKKEVLLENRSEKEFFKYGYLKNMRQKSMRFYLYKPYC